MPLTLIALGGWLVASLAAAAVLGRAISRADRISELHERRAAARAEARAAGADVEPERRLDGLADPAPVRLGLTVAQRDGVPLNG